MTWYDLVYTHTPSYNMSSLLTLSCISGATPAPSRSLAIASYPLAATKCSGPMPESVLAFTLHCTVKSSCTVSWWPFQQARCRAVHPSLRCRFTSTLAVVARSRMPSEWPLRAAQCRGLEPLLSVRLLLSLLLLTRVEIAFTCPFHAAQWRGVQPYYKKSQMF